MIVFRHRCFTAISTSKLFCVALLMLNFIDTSTWVINGSSLTNDVALATSTYVRTTMQGVLQYAHFSKVERNVTMNVTEACSMQQHLGRVHYAFDSDHTTRLGRHEFSCLLRAAQFEAPSGGSSEMFKNCSTGVGVGYGVDVDSFVECCKRYGVTTHLLDQAVASLVVEGAARSCVRSGL
jgi:hypothetical protein